MNAFTPEWAMSAFDRLRRAQREITPEERADALKDSERRQTNATIRRRLERVA